MLSISRLKMRNFKSFKFVDIPVPKTFLCLAGPNGSGKSNICDAIRFALGEKSLKSLRAKKTSDLIYTNCDGSEVTIVFEGDEKYEVKRAVRKDGKVLYRLNGKKTTRNSILETLKKHNLDESGRNVIAQGEVQRIIQMNGKERRAIIDSVAGVSDFEEKKKESMKELDIVENRIKDTNLVLGERLSFLKELEIEKETALKYLECRNNLTNAKASLLNSELKNLEEEMEKAGLLEEKLNFHIRKKLEEMNLIEQDIADSEKHRSIDSQELQLRQQSSGSMKKIEQLRVSVSSKIQQIEDHEMFVKKTEKEIETIEHEMKKQNSDILAVQVEIENMNKEIEHKKVETAKQEFVVSDQDVDAFKMILDEAIEKFHKTKETVIKIEADIIAKKEILEVKTREAEAINTNPKSKDGLLEENERDRIKKEIKEVVEDIDASFKKMKDINVEMASLEKNYLELKEKASLMRIRVSPAIMQPALAYIDELKKDGERGIYGKIADLINFDTAYSNAIEAAAGSRLLYIVVDNSATAIKLIEKLKKEGKGRATFIPLADIQTAPMQNSMQANTRLIIDVLTYDKKIKNAVAFVFGDTILAADVKDAQEKKRHGRVVTLGGEIFERSGLITGGKMESSLLTASRLQKLEQEVKKIKEQKESMIQELFALREEESKKRSRKSDMEIKLKTLEIENQQMEQEKKELEILRTKKESFNSEIKKIVQYLDAQEKEKEKLYSTVLELERKIRDYETEWKMKMSKNKELDETTQKKRMDSLSRLSSLKASLQGKINELEIRKKDIFVKDDKLKELESEKKSLLDRSTELKRQMEVDRETLLREEEKISKISMEIEKLFESLKKYEEEMQKLGKQRGEKQIELDKLNKEINQLNVKKATVQTRLQDVKTELGNYQKFEFLDLARDALLETIKENEQKITNLGNVNLTAIEMFEKKKAEIGDVQERIDKLSAERKAVLNMITELEERKKEAFFETFQTVSNQFEKMFRYISVGEGVLYLDKPGEPFESGLFIKIKRNRHEYSLDSLSGGENSLIALMFIFALQFFKPSPFYILDEIDAALDKENSKNLTLLISKMSKETQFIIVSHNDTVISSSEAVLGVTKVDGTSKIVGIKLEQIINA